MTKANLMDGKTDKHPWLTGQHLDDAPMFTLFLNWKDRCDGRCLHDDQWSLFHIGTQYPCEVEEKLQDLGIAEDILCFEPEKDDDRVASNVTDMDAVLAYLGEGGVLVKVPDSLTSGFYRFYVVTPLPPRHQYIEREEEEEAACTTEVERWFNRLLELARLQRAKDQLLDLLACKKRS